MVTLVLTAITFADPAIVMLGVPLVGAVSSRVLKEKRTRLEEELAGIIQLAKDEKREFTEEENKRRDEIRTEVEKLDKEIEQRMFEEKIEARSAGKMINDENEKNEEKEIEGYSLLRALNQVVKTGRVDGLEGELMQEAREEMRNSAINPEGNLYVPGRVIAKRNQKAMAEKRTALLAGSGGGSYFVQTDITDFIGALYDKNVLTALGAEIVSGLVGNIQIPASGGASAAWEGETDSNTDGTPTITNISASPTRLGAYGLVSKTLLAQEGNYDVENMVKMDIVNAINQELQVAAIEGTGSSEPTGILNTSGIGSVAGGTNGAAPTQDHLIDLEKEVAVDKADIGSLGFLTNPYVRAKLKKTPLDAGSGQFVWDYRGNDLMGYPVGVSTSVPNDLTKGSATALSAIIFGNFGDMKLLQWAGFDIVVNPYTNAKTNQLEIVINSFWDVLIRRAVSFAAMKDAITS